MEKFTEKGIQQLLSFFWWKKGHKIVVSNFSGCGHAETDLLTITNANYIYSFEIKISKADFKNDFKNKKYKHSRLKESKTVTKTTGLPNYFYFVVPEGLIDLRSIPAYAGLIYINGNDEIEIKKKAPRLHTKKCSTRLIRRILMTFVERNIFGSSYMYYKTKQKK